MSKNKTLFQHQDGRDVSLDDIFREMYEQAMSREITIQSTLQILIRKMEEDAGTVVVLAPLVAQLVSNSIKNQDVGLGKLAALGQRMNAPAKKGGDTGVPTLSPEDLRKLYEDPATPPSDE